MARPHQLSVPWVWIYHLSYKLLVVLALLFVLWPDVPAMYISFSDNGSLLSISSLSEVSNSELSREIDGAASKI